MVTEVFVKITHNGQTVVINLQDAAVLARFLNATLAKVYANKKGRA